MRRLLREPVLALGAALALTVVEAKRGDGRTVVIGTAFSVMATTRA